MYNLATERKGDRVYINTVESSAKNGVRLVLGDSVDLVGSLVSCLLGGFLSLPLRYISSDSMTLGGLSQLTLAPRT